GAESPPSQGSDESPTLTVAMPGWILRGGTPEYFAPEQTEGGPATTATDVYAFALVIGDMLGMPRPMRLKPESQRMPYRWARVLRRSLETDPAQRYARPADMAGALRRPDPRIVAAGATAVLLVAAMLGAVFLTNRSDTLRGTGSRLLLTE